MIWGSQVQFVSFVVFSTLFGISCLVNLVSAFFENEKLRCYSKPFCLFFLTLVSIVVSPNEPLIYLGAFFGFLGDIFLLKKRVKKWLVAGTISFLIGHLVYISQTITKISVSFKIEWYFYLLIAFALIFIFALIFRPIYLLTKRSKFFSIGGSIYFSILVFSILVAAIGFWFFGYDWYLFVLLGTIIFLTSDIILTTTLFRHDIKRRDFYIMITYLLAESFIVYGMLFTFAL